MFLYTVVFVAYLKIIDKGKGVNRLFIGGVHGKEGLSTIKALKQIKDEDVSYGKLVIHNCDESPYLSTLDPGYYQSEVGKEVLSLIKYYKPTFYVEAHCYNKKNFPKLTSTNRMSEKGVPPLIELEKGVLVGSASPSIRTNIFRKEDVCITLEMPCNPTQESLNVYLDVLRIFAASRTREELENAIKASYPKQLQTAIKYAKEFFGKYPPF
jgi:hypothetical protein